ncbi:MAG: hypothetical protein C0404_07865 [Verrucomicrobia bacterium]|nr:hypothetical protein [Verrucomicrobiota bacterium]
MKGGVTLLAVSTLLLFAALCLGYRDFTADDSYIVCRCAENLVDKGALVFNEGEPVMVFTSPVHVLLNAFLYLITGASLLPYKVLAVIAYLSSVLLVFRLGRRSGPGLLLGGIVVLVSPCVVLWVFGGLETPLLMFFATLLTSRAVGLARQSRRPNGAELAWIYGIAAMALLTRYDSVVFSAVIVAYATLRARSPGLAVRASLPALLVLLLWFMAAFLYYGDIMPVAFYCKTPGFGFERLMRNALYIVQYLWLICYIPGILAVWISCRSLCQWRESVMRAHFMELWWLHAALGLVVIYGLTMATSHMMFGFRFFVPFIPVLAFLLSDLVWRAWEACAASDNSQPAFRRRIVALACVFLLFQCSQGLHTYRFSLNGVAIGECEYRAQGLRAYNSEFMPALAAAADDIRTHWGKTPGSAARQPRIATFAAGLLPYKYKSAYIYEELVSFRHNVHEDLASSSDYVHVIWPRHGTLQAQLPKPVNHYRLVSSMSLVFDGAVEHMEVYYDASPLRHRLKPRVD